MQILQIFLLIFGLLNFAFAGSLYFHSNKSKSITFYALISVFASLWSLSCLLVGLENFPQFIFKFGANGHYIFGYLAYLSFFWFAYFFPFKIKGTLPFLGALALTILSFFLLAAIPTTHILFAQLKENVSLANAISFNTPGYIIFILSLTFTFTTGLTLLLYRLRRSSEQILSEINFTREQVYFAILSNLIAGTLGITFNLIFPLYGNFSLFYVNPIFVTLSLTVIGFYNLIKYKLFNVRTVLAEFFTAGVWIIFLTRLVLSTNPQERLLNIVYLGCVTVFGVFLVRSVLQEVRQRELIQKQEEELEIANKQQENLLHFISHEVKGYLAKAGSVFAMVEEGDYGAVSPELKNLVTAALADNRRGVATVMDILNASNLKKGTVTYNMQPFDFKKEVEEIVQNHQGAIQEKHLTLSLNIAPGEYTLVGDKEQLGKHVINNLIDNAIKYTPQGTVNVSICRSDNSVIFMVKDSGVGITAEDKKRLFTPGGHGKDSLKVNTHSTGYGLFIAKSIVDAHKGKIYAESEGSGKGSTFAVEIPTTLSTTVPVQTAPNSVSSNEQHTTTIPVQSAAPTQG